MSLIRFEKPLPIDFTAYLDGKGVFVPNARIKIYSAYYSRSNLLAGYAHFYLGENDFRNKSDFAMMLDNYSRQPQNWYYNQTNFAIYETLERWKNDQANK